MASAVQPLPGCGRQHLGHVPDERPGVDRRAQRRPRRARLLVGRDDGEHFTVAREYGQLVGSVTVAPAYAWVFGRDDGSTGEPDHVLVTTDATTWTRLLLAP
ncbi:hypothetical protein AB0283_10305 [Micromonospora vinacea]|uniref:hypothetical protein n=1 Tax=Micromonospora vinacea TaxID=709878 RepID=UPI00344B5CE0